MERNKELQAQEALDISVLLKNMSNSNAFEFVINIIEIAHNANESIQEYLDYLWGEYANDDPWEKEVNKHTPHRTAIHKLEKKLLSFIMQEVWAHKNIPQLAGNYNPIDIKSLVYEMNDDEGVGLLNTLIEKVNDKIECLELYGIHGEELTEEKQKDLDELADLKDKMQAIVNEQVRLNKQWQNGVDKLEEERARENAEMIDALNQKESVINVSETKTNNKEVVTAVVNADDVILPC